MNGPDLLMPAPVQAAPLAEMRNHTSFESQYFQMMDTGDEVFHVIACRVTYDLARLDADGTPQLAQHQVPLVDADQFYAQPTTSSCIQESDFAPYKPQCDILLANATAYSPEGQPERRWPVGARIGNWQKVLAVTGPRRMHEGVLGWKVTEPEKATEVPLRWELAYGGTCQWPLHPAADQEPEIWAPYEANPIGCGWVDKAWHKKSRLDEFPAPQIEAFNQPFDANAANAMRYTPVGVGPVGKWWTPRRAKGGTYDQAWKESRWPRLPKDFDFGYWNCAPEDQQIPYPEGGEEILLVGLTPGQRVFKCQLPPPAVHAVARLKVGPVLPLPMRLDTVTVDFKARTLSCVWRIQVAAQFGVRVLELRRGQVPA
ncbi:DUF2169 domain-containing protein [Acidovorax sp. NPDC077693]|uniref:DUF2169 family type VI secretion system accessory protein n=1 Tax=unclassified Acidovorax TaxID=2684926 RepID=UPI0037CCA672